jgi:hypothetical protein
MRFPQAHFARGTAILAQMSDRTAVLNMGRPAPGSISFLEYSKGSVGKVVVVGDKELAVGGKPSALKAWSN